MSEITKVAFVTGGGSGIGRALALEFAKAGYDVGLSYASSDIGAREVADEIKALGRRSFIIQADISEYDQIVNMFDKFKLEFNRLDVFINNAGITKKSAFLETTEELFDSICDVDLKGTYFCTQMAAKAMLEFETPGSIIMISSNNSIAHFADVSVYGTVKAAVNKLAEHCAIELAKDKIRVNTIAPGWTDTGSARLDDKADTYYKVPLQKWATPKEIADAALYLSSDSACSITGTTLVIDNGALLVSDKRERYGF